MSPASSYTTVLASFTSLIERRTPSEWVRGRPPQDDGHGDESGTLSSRRYQQCWRRKTQATACPGKP